MNKVVLTLYCFKPNWLNLSFIRLLWKEKSLMVLPQVLDNQLKYWSRIDDHLHAMND